MDYNKEVYRIEYHEFLDKWMVVNVETKQMLRMCDSKAEAEALVVRLKAQDKRKK